MQENTKRNYELIYLAELENMQEAKLAYGAGSTTPEATEE